MIIALLFAVLLNPVQQALSETVVVSVDEHGIPNADVCSGFVIGADGLLTIVATARHCTHAHVRFVQFYDGDHASVVRIKPSKVADVALLYVQPHHTHPIASVEKDVVIGLPYFTIGSASGDAFSYASLRSRNGNVTIEDYGPLLMFEGPSVYLGDSGAGIFDSAGNVCAVVDAINDPERPAVVFAAPIAYVTDLLKP